MNDPSVMRRLERTREFPRDGKCLVWRQRPDLQAITQCRPFDELQHQKPHVVELLDAVDCCDMRMIERRENPRLPLEAGEPLRVGSQGARQNLDRHVSSEFGVSCAVDLAHAAAAQHTEHLEGAEAVARLERRRHSV